MKMKKAVAVIVILALLVGCFLLTLSACNKDTEPKRAIIYVTALFSGGLYDSVTGEAVWEPFTEEFNVYDHVDENGVIDFAPLIPKIVPQIGLVLQALTYKPGTLLYDMTLDQDGNSNNPDLIPANGEPVDPNTGKAMDISYGVFGIYKPIYEDLNAKYGDEYEVSVFNYDWRYSPADAAAKLEKYINDNGYDEVVLLSHSMGGSTVNSYLARSQANRDKVKLYMGYAPATMGSFDALAALSCPLEYVEHFLAGMDLSALSEGDSALPVDLSGMTTDDIKGKISPILEKVQDFLINNQGLIDLIPSWQFLASDQYGDGEHGIVVDGQPIDSKDELYAWYETQDWAYYLDEDGNRMMATEGQPANEDGYRIKDVVANLESYYDSFYIDGKFVSTYINAYYMVGSELGTTLTGLSYTSGEDGGEYALYTSATLGSKKAGDGTVPFYSALGGQSVDEIENGRIVDYVNKNHLDVGANWELMKDKAYELIDALDA